MPALPPHIRACFDPVTYPHPVHHIRLIETHISWLFLTGSFVYKFKKPVDFGFLDFTTLDKRQRDCQRELQLNRRLAAPLYHAVVPLTCASNRSGEHVQLGGDGEVVDYALKMTQFEQHDLLSRRLQQGGFDPAWMDQLATTIARFHRDSAPHPERDAATLLAAHLQENLRIGRQYAAQHQAHTSLTTLDHFLATALPALMPQLHQRQAQIRDCHGDLHLNNIALYQGEPIAFDCIEFNDDYRIIDCMNDVAFLVMDCDARGHHGLGMRFLARYLEQSSDYAGLSLLPLYLIYRATVRAKVACLLATEATESHEAAWQEAADYFDLAASYCAPRRPHLFAVGGLSGSGKSHLANLGMAQCGALSIRTDAVRRRIAPQHRHLPRYSDAMHRLTYQQLFADAEAALEAGFSVILDATFLHPKSRRSVQQLAQRCAVPLHFFWLNIPPEQLRENIRQRQHDISEADLDVLEQQLRDYHSPQEPFIHHLSSANHWPASSYTAGTKKGLPL